jgi:hypothetical protein
MRRLWTVLVMLVALSGLSSRASAQDEQSFAKVLLASGGSDRVSLSTGNGAPSGLTNGSLYVDYGSTPVDLYIKVGGTWEKVPRLTSTLNIWTGTGVVVNTEPALWFNETDQGANLKQWRFDVQSAVLNVQTIDDANALLATVLTLNRAGNLAIAGTLNVPGTSTLANVSVGGTLGVTSTATFSSDGLFLTKLRTPDIWDNGGSLTLETVGSGRNLLLTPFSASEYVQVTQGGVKLGATSGVTSGPALTSNTTAISLDPATGDWVQLAVNRGLGAIVGATLKGQGYVSGTTGWGITQAGVVDARAIVSEEIQAKTFVAQYEQAIGGAEILTKANAPLAATFTVPGAGALVSTITRSGSTATLTTLSAHGLSTGDQVWVSGATQTEYNGLFTITVTDTTHYTYAVTGTPATPATGSPVARGATTLDVEDAPGAAGVAVFEAGDTVVLRTVARTTAGGLTVGDAVGVVVSGPSTLTGHQQWVWARNQTSGMTGSLARGVTIAAKGLALDYGTSGTGYIESAVVDGTVGTVSITRSGSTATLTTSSPHGYKTGDVIFVSGATQPEYNGSFVVTVTGTTTFTYAITGTPATPATGTILVNAANGINAPYLRMTTWTGAPTAPNRTPRVNLGQARGITGVNEYGLLAGAFASTNGAYLRATDQNFDLHGVTAKWWDGSTNVVTIAPNSGSPYLSLGNPAPSAFGTSGIWLGWDHGSTLAQASFYSDATHYLKWDGLKFYWSATNASLDTAGNLTLNGGDITLTGQSTSFVAGAMYKFSAVLGGGSGDRFGMGSYSGAHCIAGGCALSTNARDLTIENIVVPTSSSNNRAASVTLSAAGWNGSLTAASNAASLTLSSGSGSSGTNASAAQLWADSSAVTGTFATGTLLDTTSYTQSNGNTLKGDNGEALGIAGSTSLANLNFYIKGIAQRKATFQAAVVGTNGGSLTVFTKTDGDSDVSAKCAFSLGLTCGSPTGGDKGVGTINATAIYDDNVLLTDWVFDDAYGVQGRAPSPKPAGHTKQLYALDVTRAVTQTDHRLPWMPSTQTFEAERGLGRMLTSIWQGQEQQQLYIFELLDRIAALEQSVAAIKGGK